MASLPPCLFRQSSGIFKYRRRVPDRLKGQTIGGITFPALEWAQSLGTRDPLEARRKHRDIDDEIRSQIEVAEQILTNDAGGTETIQAREMRIVAAQAERDRAARHADREPLRLAWRHRLQLSTEALTPEEAAARDLIREASAQPEDYQRAQAVFEASAERIVGKTLAEAVRVYSERVLPTKAASTVRSNRTAFAFLLEAIGGGKRLPSIDRDVARRALWILERQPRDQWVGRGQAPFERYRIAERDGLERLSSKSITDSYLSFWNALFGYAERERWIDRNPFSMLAREVNGRQTERRQAFTGAELARLFDSPPWSSGDTAPGGKPIRYWGPLLALFHGLRRGEIASLRADSFEKSEPGIVVFEVHGTKTDNAQRRHAMHPELYRLGLFDLATARKGRGTLFADETADGRGIWGDGFGDWFSRHRVALGVGTRGQGLHAFRHNWEDALREADLHQTPIAQYLGGRAALDPVGGDYGRGYSAAKLYEAISKVDYPMLQFSRKL